METVIRRTIRGGLKSCAITCAIMLSLVYRCIACVNHPIQRKAEHMFRSECKFKTSVRNLNIVKVYYQRSRAEQEQELDMLGSAIETLRRAFFRSFRES